MLFQSSRKLNIKAVVGSDKTGANQDQYNFSSCELGVDLGIKLTARLQFSVVPSGNFPFPL
jgi:hypothetical protein